PRQVESARLARVEGDPWGRARAGRGLRYRRPEALAEVERVGESIGSAGGLIGGRILELADQPVRREQGQVRIVFGESALGTAKTLAVDRRLVAEAADVGPGARLGSYRPALGSPE